MTHPPLAAPFTQGINSEDKHEGKSQILKEQEERVHVSPTTSHALQGRGLQCQVTVRVLCPLGYGPHSSACNRKQPAVHNTRDVLTREQASILVSDKSRREQLLQEK